MPESTLPPPPPPPPPTPETIYEPLKPNPNAMEIFLLVLALSSATMLIVNPDRPDEGSALGPIWAWLWAITLIGGGLLALIGIFWRGKAIVAVGLQEVGYTLFSITSIARIIALVDIGEIYTAYYIGLFALASGIRVVQLEHKVWRFRNIRATCPIKRFRRRGRHASNG